ncbi:hypothetical protein TWF106_000189 [Orbilia oligospora]|uniref:Hydrogen voltage-gated channel 1 n=1 Tax=Orbilia oligospora TaxID=2813651 RepID=A0A7C8R111_ORBOL|nr:hypothetical protein TWF106_000044 [Orbilia oligospora]KAF3229800.1 hypothetical protein TWF106_000189 [Orbilia oligospora]
MICSLLFHNLFICELSRHASRITRFPQRDPHHNPAPQTSFALSCLFLAELSVTLVVFGVGYLEQWIHALDAAIITIRLFVDIILRNGVVEVAGLVVVLRLWRLIKSQRNALLKPIKKWKRNWDGRKVESSI